MAVLDFPSDTSQSPYEENGITYEWDGQKWIITSGGGSGGGGGDLTLQEVTDNGNRTTTQINVGEATNTDGRVALIAPDLGTSDARGRLLLNAKASAAGGSQVLQSFHGDTETLRVSAGGSLYLGGDIQNDNGNIWLRGSNGEATFAGNVTIGGANDRQIQLYSGGIVEIDRASGDGSGNVFRTNLDGTRTITFLADGSAEFAGGNITLNADGSGLFSGNVQVDGQSSAALFLAQDGVGAKTTLYQAKVGSDTVFAVSGPNGLGNAGSVLIGGSDPLSDPNISLKVDGSATFDGRVTVKRDDATDAGLAIQKPDGTNVHLLYGNGNATFAENKISFTGTNGSATFASSVSTDADFNAAGNVTASGAAITCGNNPNAAGQVGIRMRSMGTLQATNDGGAFLQLMQLGNTTPTVQINANGSATFAGTVQSGGDALNGTAPGVLLRGTSGMIHVTTPDQSSAVFHAFTQSDSNPTITLRGNGSADFVGGINAFNAISCRRPIGNLWEGYDTNSGLDLTSEILYSGDAKFESIVFEGNATPSGNNRLNDYEEGTWTPQDQNDADIADCTAYYRKVGSIVTCEVSFQGDAINGVTQIRNLPFTGKQTQYNGMVNLGYMMKVQGGLPESFTTSTHYLYANSVAGFTTARFANPPAANEFAFTDYQAWTFSYISE